MVVRKRTAKEIIDLSTPAICGVSEREVSIRKERVPSTVKTLRKAGFYIVGESYGDTRIKKLWFTRAGSL